MLGHARSKVAPSDRLEWRTADAAALPFADGTFDAIACQFGLMFVPDKALAFREARRVLRTGGRLFFNVWCRIEENPFARIAHTTIAKFFGAQPPTFYQVPFGFHDAEVIAAHLTASRFDDVTLERVSFGLSAPSAHDFARGLVEGNPIANAIREANLPFAKVVDSVKAALVAEGGDAPFQSKMNALVCSARAA
jgi:SAM-dependent methyltransferase